MAVVVYGLHRFSFIAAACIVDFTFLGVSLETWNIRA